MGSIRYISLTMTNNFNPANVFTYELPPERIAQRPVHPYDAAKLLIADRKIEKLTEGVFSNFADLVSEKDLLIFNNTKVIPARLRGKIQGRNSEVELLLHQELSHGVWSSLGRPLKKLKAGTVVEFERKLLAEVKERISDREIRVEFSVKEGELEAVLEASGIMPIPPYIRGGEADEQDRTDYQTIFAEHRGSVAAPTASLHFTPELMKRIKEKGCSVEHATLHVGPPSFLPLWHQGDSEEEKQEKRPGREEFLYSGTLLQKIKDTKAAGGRVIAVGTTIVRALESMIRQDKETAEGEALDTELFIYPGFEFQAVDAIVTNFHQPGTTHLLLVQAFTDRKLLEESYQYALDNNFRFLSYGDGMLLI